MDFETDCNNKNDSAEDMEYCNDCNEDMEHCNDHTEDVVHCNSAFDDPEITIATPITSAGIATSTVSGDSNCCCTCSHRDIDQDIVISVIKAFQLMEEMDGSQKNFLDILKFGKDIYCSFKGDSETLKKWPSSWYACNAILKNAGYKEPDVYNICLNESHPTLWSIMADPENTCKYCKNPGSIQYYYLPLADKVRRWCSSKEFCEKITAHWNHRQSWMKDTDTMCQHLNEIWDGSRFTELEWFWNPNKTWALPTRCEFYKQVVGVNSFDIHDDSVTEGTEINVECPNCFHHFKHNLHFTQGDPRNIALIGHWDGWQPFSSSVKHGCGKQVISS